MKQITAIELQSYLAADNHPIMIDVRELKELVHGMIVGAIHIPVSEVEGKLGEFETNKKDTIILICRSGKRSAQVGLFMQHMGFSDTINLDGGMNAWAADVDNTMTVY